MDQRISSVFSQTRLHWSDCLQYSIFQCDSSLPSLPTFPLILGRRPTLETGPANNSLEKENRAPENVVAGMADTMLSKATNLSNTGRQRRIAGVGVATLLADGNVRVNYTDGSCLVLRSQTDTVEFCPTTTGGQWHQYSQDNMPDLVRSKLSSMPRILESLMSSSGSTR